MYFEILPAKTQTPRGPPYVEPGCGTRGVFDISPTITIWVMQSFQSGR
jgi:hypothetical protein